MKLSPTEIFKGKTIFLIGGTGFVGKVTLPMSYRGRNAEMTMKLQPIIGLCNVTD